MFVARQGGTNLSYAPLANVESKSPRLGRSGLSSCARLEQSGWPSGPVFSLIPGDCLHIVHVGAGLGDHVMQVVTDTDEGKTLFQEFSYPSCAEQEKAENDLILMRIVD